MALLAGRVGIVTGASAGIGAAVGRALAAEGMHVALAARRGDRLDALVADIRRDGGAAEAVVTDLRDEAQVEALVDGTLARHGRLDALVNNAAVGYVRLVADGRTEEWRETLETNVLGMLVACRAALRHMLPCGRGDILNMSSAATAAAWPYLAAYAASKAAVQAFTRALRAEVAAQGIRVMAIEIHNVASEFGVRFDPAVTPAALKRWHELGLVNPEAALLAPEDVARAVVFQLAQPDPASIHELTIRSRAN